MIIPTGITVCLLACSVLSGPVRDDSETVFRLEDHVKPQTYEIDLELDEDLNKINGHVKITTIVVKKWDEATERSIYLHKSESIAIDSVVVTAKDDTSIGGDSSSMPNEILKIPIMDGHEINDEDEIEIDINYKLDIEAATGLNIISYDADEKGTLLVTHFQPTYARSVFPCFDEPKFQAKFKLTLKNLPPKYKALSNTDLEPGDENEAKFKESPKMSTYMLAFIVYHEDSFGKITESPTREAITFNTWGRKSQLEGTVDFGKDYGSKLIGEMETYTNIAYDGTVQSESTGEDKLDDVVEKLDQVGIPSYTHEPMETFGLATYDESAILLKNTGHKKVAKDKAIKTIAYGVAHHWFGDLVTSEWWDSAWLNEGFSTFFDYYLTEKAIPEEEWRMEDRLVVEEQMRALEIDAYLASPALSADPASNEEILNRFGVIASSKGASVLRMFQNVVGENFQTAVQSYLNDHVTDGIANQDALFEKLATEDVTEEYFEEWAQTKGFPLITVTISEETQVEGEEGTEEASGDESGDGSEGEGEETPKGIKLTQERYLLDGTNEDRDVVYNLHLKILTNAAKDSEIRNPIILNEKEKIVPGDTDNNTWILVKTDGYFRVNYSDGNWKLLAKHLKEHLADDSENGKAEENESDDIVPLERAVLVDNALYLAKEGHLEYSHALDLVNYLKEEEDYIPWAAAIPGLDFLHRMVASTAAAREESFTFDDFIANITDRVFERLSKLQTYSHIDKIHYSRIQHLACRAGNEKCLKATEAKFADYLSGTKPDEDLRSSIYCYGVRNNADNWNKLWKSLTGKEVSEGSGKSTEPKILKQSKAEVSVEERSDMIYALGCSLSPAKLELYLGETIEATNPAILPEEIPSVFSSVYRNIDGIDVALKFMKENIKTLEEKGTEATSIIVQDMAKYLKTNAHKETLKEIQSNSDAADAVFEEALEELANNIKWLTQYEDKVAKAVNSVLTSGNNGGSWSVRPGTLLVLVSFFVAFIFL